MLHQVIPELELFPTAGERRGHLAAALRYAVRPSTFWSSGTILVFVAMCVVLILGTSSLLPPLYSTILVYSAPFAFPYVLTRAGIGRVRRVLRERLNVAGLACCLNCGYSMAGLTGPVRCPECNADCSNLLEHAGAPIAESGVFPELLGFSRPGEAKEALLLAYEEAVPFYQYRFKMLLPLAVCTAMGIALVGSLTTSERGDPVVPEEFLWCAGLVMFTGAAFAWHGMLRGAVRDSLERQLEERSRAAGARA